VEVEIIIFGGCCQITLRPFVFPIGSLDEVLIPIGPLFQLLYKSQALKKNLFEAAEKCKKFSSVRGSIYETI
jgi:hypothetical protein